MSNRNSELPTLQISNDEIWLHWKLEGKIYFIRRQGELHLEDNQEGSLYRITWRNESKQALIKRLFEIELYSRPITMTQVNPESLSEPIFTVNRRLIRTTLPNILEPYAVDSGFGTTERWLYELSKEIIDVPLYPETETFDLLEVCDFGQYLQNIGRQKVRIKSKN